MVFLWTEIVSLLEFPASVEKNDLYTDRKIFVSQAMIVFMK